MYFQNLTIYYYSSEWFVSPSQSIPIFVLALSVAQAEKNILSLSYFCSRSVIRFARPDKLYLCEINNLFVSSPITSNIANNKVSETCVCVCDQSMIIMNISSISIIMICIMIIMIMMMIIGANCFGAVCRLLHPIKLLGQLDRPFAH